MRNRTKSVFARIRASRSACVGLILIFLILLMAFLAPYIGITDPNAINLQARLASPDLTNLLGTDQAGRDLASRVIWGNRYSLLVALGAVMFGSIVGVALGLTAGYLSGTFFEQIITRLFDLMFAIPTLIWAIAVIGVIGTGAITFGSIKIGSELKLIILIGLSFVPALGRITYAATLVEVKADYVRAKRALGASPFEIAVVEILPNALPPVLVQATLFVGVAIIVEASLSFVGLGIQPPTPSWGTMLSDARSYIFSGHWWLPVFPGAAIFVTVLAFNIFGDGLRDAIDPKGTSKSAVV